MARGLADVIDSNDLERALASASAMIRWQNATHDEINKTWEASRIVSTDSLLGKLFGSTNPLTTMKADQRFYPPGSLTVR